MMLSPTSTIEWPTTPAGLRPRAVGTRARGTHSVGRLAATRTPACISRGRAQHSADSRPPLAPVTFASSACDPDWLLPLFTDSSESPTVELTSFGDDAVGPFHQRNES